MAETTPTPQGATEGQSTAPQTQATTDPKGQSASAPSTDETANKLLAGKFKAVPDLEKSYAEAQKELTKAKQELAELRKGQAAKPAAEGEQSEKPEAPKGKETAEQKRVRMGEVLMQEYMEKGSLSEAARLKAVEELGLPPAVIADFEKYLSAQKDAGLKKVKDTFSEFGDFDLNAVIDGMSRSLPAERLNAIQTLIDAGDIEVLRPYIKAHVKAQLPEGQVGRAGGTGAGGFKDVAERRAAMNDPKFGVNKDYTAAFWKRNDASADNIKLVR